MNKLYEAQRNKINADVSLSETDRMRAHRSLNDTYHIYGVKCEAEDCAYNGRGDNVDVPCPECGKSTLDWSDAL